MWVKYNEFVSVSSQLCDRRDALLNLNLYSRVVAEYVGDPAPEDKYYRYYAVTAYSDLCPELDTYSYREYYVRLASYCTLDEAKDALEKLLYALSQNSTMFTMPKSTYVGTV